MLSQIYALFLYIYSRNYTQSKFQLTGGAPICILSTVKVKITATFSGNFLFDECDRVRVFFAVALSVSLFSGTALAIHCAAHSKLVRPLNIYAERKA